MFNFTEVELKALRKIELAEAMARGIREYLDTIRGASAFGAGTTVKVEADGALEIKAGKDGHVMYVHTTEYWR